MGHRSRQGAAWRTTKQPSVHHGGAWRTATAAWIRQGGTWVKWWPDLPDRGGPYLFGAISSCGPNICRFDGSLWVSVGGGRDAQVLNLHVANNGEVCALGLFTSPSELAVYNGSWTQPTGAPAGLYQGFLSHDGSNFVCTLIAGTSGNLYNVVNGFSARRTVNKSPYPTINYIATGPVGDYAIGSFSSPTTNDVCWNGSGANNIGGDYYKIMLVNTIDGKVHQCSTNDFSSYHVYGDDGDGQNTWSLIGTSTGFNNTVTGIEALPDGRVFACGTFTSVDGVSANGLAHWDGSAWSQIGGGLSDVVGISFHQNKLWILAGPSLGNRDVYVWDGTTLTTHSWWAGEFVRGIR